MAGRDQSANLTGMLSDIGATVGSMGDAYKPVLQAATKPRGDMSDPAHLQSLAQWATQNGDAAAASMYMSQAREAKAEQKDKNTMANMAMSDKATMTGNVTAQQIAQQGDVTNLDRRIADLTDRMQGEFPSVQARNYAKQNLESLKAMRSGAQDVQVQNHAKAVGSIDAALADPSIEGRKSVQQNPDGTTTEVPLKESLLARKEEMLKDPKVQETLTTQAVEKGRAEREQLAFEGEQYLTDNVAAIQEAIVTGDLDKIDEIRDGANGYKAQAAVQAFADNAQKVSDDRDRRDDLNRVQTVYDYDLVAEQVKDINPDLLKASGYHEAIRQVELSEQNRSGEGKQLLTTGHRLQAQKARDAVDKAIADAQMQEATAKYQNELRRGEETEAKLDELRSERELYRPTDTAIAARARLLAQEANDYIEHDGGNYVLNTGAYQADAASSLRTDKRKDLDREIAILSGEEPEVREFNRTEEAAIAQGMAAAVAQGKPMSREAVIAYIDDNDGWEKLAKSSLKEVTVDYEKKDSRPPSRQGASHIYDGSILTEGANAVGGVYKGVYEGVPDMMEAGVNAVGGYLTARGDRAKEKLNR